jgi:hypothetical protein
MNIGELKRAIEESGMADDAEVIINQDLNGVGEVVAKYFVRMERFYSKECSDEDDQQAALGKLKAQYPDSKSYACQCLLIVAQDHWDDEYDDLDDDDD